MALFSKIEKDYMTMKTIINWDNLQKNYAQYSKSPHFKFGVPFFLFVVGASFGLKYFTHLRYKYRAVSTFRDDAEKLGIEVKPSEEITLESEYKKVLELDIDNWENVRIPRPWEPPAEKEK